MKKKSKTLTKSEGKKLLKYFREEEEDFCEAIKERHINEKEKVKVKTPAKTTSDNN